MNRPSVNQSQIAALSVRQFLFLGMALLLTLAASQVYYSWQTARLADQVAAQTALLAQLKAEHATTLVKATQALPVSRTSPATVERVVVQERWVF